MEKLKIWKLIALKLFMPRQHLFSLRCPTGFSAPGGSAIVIQERRQWLAACFAPPSPLSSLPAISSSASAQLSPFLEVMKFNQYGRVELRGRLRLNFVSLEFIYWKPHFQHDFIWSWGLWGSDDG